MFPIIRRTKHSRGCAHERDDLPLIPSMIPSRDDINTKIQKLLSHFRQDSVSVSHIFTVGDHKINLM